MICFTKPLAFNEIFLIKQSLPEIYELLRNVAEIFTISKDLNFKIKNYLSSPDFISDFVYIKLDFHFPVRTENGKAKRYRHAQ